MCDDRTCASACDRASHPPLRPPSPCYLPGGLCRDDPPPSARKTGTSLTSLRLRQVILLGDKTGSRPAPRQGPRRPCGCATRRSVEEAPARDQSGTACASRRPNSNAWSSSSSHRAGASSDSSWPTAATACTPDPDARHHHGRPPAADRPSAPPPPSPPSISAASRPTPGRLHLARSTVIRCRCPTRTLLSLSQRRRHIHALGTQTTNANGVPSTSPSPDRDHASYVLFFHRTGTFMAPPASGVTGLRRQPDRSLDHAERRLGHPRRMRSRSPASLTENGSPLAGKTVELRAPHRSAATPRGPKTRGDVTTASDVPFAPFLAASYFCHHLPMLFRHTDVDAPPSARLSSYWSAGPPRCPPGSTAIPCGARCSPAQQPGSRQARDPAV